LTRSGGSIDTNYVIARITIYGRIPTPGTGCDCHIFSPNTSTIDTIEITVGEYLRGRPFVSGEFVGMEIDTLIDFEAAGVPVTRRQSIESSESERAAARMALIGDNIEDSSSIPGDCDANCQNFLTQTADAGSVRRPGVTGSDVYISIHSTGLVPLHFARQRISQYPFKVLESGGFDILIDSMITRLYTIPNALNTLKRIGLMDEPYTPNFTAVGMLSDKVQRLIDTVYSSNRRQTFTVLYGWYDTYRAFSNDLDPRGFKKVQMTAQDFYPIPEFAPIPYYYGRRHDSMSAAADTTYYKNLVRTNTDTAAAFYTDWINRVCLGSSYDYNRDVYPEQTTIGGKYLPRFIRLVDVSRYKYRHINPSPSEALNFVQVHGYMVTDTAADHYPKDAFTLNRYPTPEEIKVQAWLSLNGGANGIIFSAFHHTGSMNGPMRIQYDGSGHATNNDSLWEYMSLAPPGRTGEAGWTLPRMWTGNRSRLDTIKSVILEIRKIKPVYDRLEFTPGMHKTAYDNRMSYRSLPLIDSLRTEKSTNTTENVFAATGQFDRWDTTYAEVTHFDPGPRDTVGRMTGAHYLLITNRRVHPIDYKTYNIASGSTTGRKHIDVRRMWVKLKSTDLVTSEYKIERIGYSGSRSDSVGKFIDLDWLKPGDGALYRFTPVPQAVSANGTAFNNSVHSENPSTGSAQQDRLVVTERDSVVWLTAVDSAGNSQSWQISGAGINMHPALATIRGIGRTSALVVWENRDSANTLGRVQALYLDSLPRRGSPLSDSTSFKLCDYQSLNASLGWQRLVPAVVALDTGYVVSWASPTNGIKVRAVRDLPNLNPAIDISDTLVVKGNTVQYRGGTVTLGSASQFPTLAYYRFPDTTNYQRVHLAYQQGTPNMANTQFIMYNRLGVCFNLLASPRPLLIASATEHVSQSLPGSLSAYHE
jgi:hypothetical protein